MSKNKLSTSRRIRAGLVVAFVGVFLLAWSESAFALSSANYTIPQYSLPSFSQVPNSEHYKLLSGSQSLAGVASSASYGLDAGFPSQTGGVISISVDSTSIDLGALSPGTPITGTTTVTVATDASGYNLAIEKSKLMTHSDSTTTIADFSGSIASPSVWSGAGFGFSVSAGTSLEAKWGVGTKFAAIPTQLATVVHSVNQVINAPDETTITYKLDADPSQTSGNYSTLVAFTATILP